MTSGRLLIVSALLVGGLIAEAGLGQIESRRSENGTLVLVSRAKPTVSTRGLQRQRPPQVLVNVIEAHARSQQLDPRLVESLIQVESGFDSRALSNKGAIGLMQLMPGTAADLGVDPWDPLENIRGGTVYLRGLLDRFEGDLELALAGYNAGPGAVERHRGIPPYRETTAYVTKVLSLYRGLDGATLSSAGLPTARRGRSVTSRRDENGRLVLTTP